MARAFMTEYTDSGRRDQHGAGGRLRHGQGPWRRGLMPALVALALGLALFLHAEIPNTVGNLGSLWETFLPWGGLLIPVLLVVALLRRSVLALVALLVPAAVWLDLFGGLMSDKTGSGGDLTVVTHNVGAANPDPVGTAQQLENSGADVLALEEIDGKRVELYGKQLADTYPHHTVQGTVGVWSRHPLSDSAPVDTGMGWKRALRTTVTSPQGDVAVYAAHLPSVRLQFRSGFTAGQRDEAARMLGDAIAADDVGSVILLGDLNGTMNDRALAPVTSQMRSTQGAAGDGMGFSWPARFPSTRIDQIMVKDLEPVSSWTLSATGSDHLPVAASVDVR